MRSINFFRASVRKYFSSSKDPNIQQDGSSLIGQLKRLVYSKSRSQSETERILGLVTSYRAQLSFNECIEAVYLLSRLTREQGGALSAPEVNKILIKIQEQMGDASRTDLIRLIQVCSLVLNRNKASAGDSASQKVQTLVDEIVDYSISKIKGRLCDIPTSSLTQVISSLARQYRPSVDGLIQEIGMETAKRIRKCVDPKGEYSIVRFPLRSDLHRATPYSLLAYGQIGIECPPELVEASLDLFQNSKDEIPYNFLTLYVYALSLGKSSPISEDPRFNGLLDYMTEVSSCNQKRMDLTLHDVCRLCLGSRGTIQFDKFVACLGEMIVTRSSDEFTVHVLKDLGSLIKDLPESNKRGIARIFKELDRVSYQLPAPYAVDILENLVSSQKRISSYFPRFISRQITKNLKRMGPLHLQRTIAILNALKISDDDVRLKAINEATDQLSRKFHHSLD
jgi:hypothetical protein